MLDVSLFLSVSILIYSLEFNQCFSGKHVARKAQVVGCFLSPRGLEVHKELEFLDLVDYIGEINIFV